VVFAYHDVGVRCLRVLLAHEMQVALVVTHTDAPGERIWFDSVAQHAAWHGIPVITPENPNTADCVERVRAARPDFLFSFYYRSLLGPDLLALPARGAYNMHGSLLPRYRGRVPINWAVLHGEVETGATLHAMTVKPDAGDIVAQQAVPILPDDTAGEVFRKVTVAAELALHRCLPALIEGRAPHTAQNLALGSYYGRRTERDGAIDWRTGARAVHNLVRAVAPPYPGAFTQAGTAALRILRTLPVAAEAVPPPLADAGGEAPALRWYGGNVYALCHDGVLKLLEFELDGRPGDARLIHQCFGERFVPLRPCME
jgi:methionyl-tRNA formyltransferase